MTISLTPSIGYYPVLNVDGVNVTLTNNAYALSMSNDPRVYVIFTRP